MYFIMWLLFGAAVGWVASIIMKKQNHMGWVTNIIIGIIGSILGVWLVGVLGFGSPDTFTVVGFFVSIGGAALLIVIITAIKRRVS